MYCSYCGIYNTLPRKEYTKLGVLKIHAEQLKPLHRAQSLTYRGNIGSVYARNVALHYSPQQQCWSRMQKCEQSLACIGHGAGGQLAPEINVTDEHFEKPVTRLPVMWMQHNKQQPDYTANIFLLTPIIKPFLKLVCQVQNCSDSNCLRLRPNVVNHSQQLKVIIFHFVIMNLLTCYARFQTFLPLCTYKHCYEYCIDKEQNT